MSTTTPSSAALLDRLRAHEVGVRNARPRLAHRHLLVYFLVRVQQRVDRAVAHRMGGELQARLDRRLDDRQ